MLGNKATQAEVEPVLNQLVAHELVAMYVTSFLTVPLQRPIRVYQIRDAGLKFLGGKKK